MLITALESHLKEELSVEYIKTKLTGEYERRTLNKNIPIMHMHAFKGKEERGRNSVSSTPVMERTTTKMINMNKGK